MDLSKLQFSAWCNAFYEFRNSGIIVIRFYSGDVVALCRALYLFSNLGTSSPDILDSAWFASRIDLNQLSSGQLPAPVTFDVIDTSNVVDHVGLLHLLLVAQPILKRDPESKLILYTEELIHVVESNVNPFPKRLCELDTSEDSKDDPIAMDGQRTRLVT
ncbi:hypothetical protein RhiJN_10403 [Ceratobasidium sp. AG-Ba]|nr:hypothetical protein RhiJN_10403 [Ceratobasidium sp. AG-Ba]